MSLQLCSAWYFLYTQKTPKNYREDRPSRKCLLNEPESDPSKRGGNAGHGRSIASEQPDRQQHERSTAVIAATDWAKTAKNNKSKWRQREFIPSWLEKCGLGIIM